jgi:nucleoside-diphosphate-sugar epimerase
MVIPNFVRRACRRGDHGLRRRHPAAPRSHIVADVVHALLKLVKEPKAVGQVINIGNTGEISPEAGRARA